MTADKHKRPYPSAAQGAKDADRFEQSAQMLSPSYRLAFADHDFLWSDELRPVRLHLELLKAEIAMRDRGISSTVVVFGSARLPEPARARELLARAEAEARRRPDDESAAEHLAIARRKAENAKYYAEAREFARLMSAAGPTDSDDGYVVITGGGGGVMEAANRGASDVGADSIGLNIVLPQEQTPNSYITPELCFQFHYFAIRKMNFLMRAKALAIFPGGFGTLDELFDALTLIQTGKIEPLPVLLFGEEYWRKIINFDAMVEEGVISREDASLIRYVETAREACGLIRAFYDGANGE